MSRLLVKWTADNATITMVETLRYLKEQQELPGISDSLPSIRGKYTKLTNQQLKSKTPKLFYSCPNGEIWHGDTISWLKKLPSESVDFVFADPPYNIKKQNGTHLNRNKNILNGL